MGKTETDQSIRLVPRLPYVTHTHTGGGRTDEEKSREN